MASSTPTSLSRTRIICILDEATECLGESRCLRDSSYGGREIALKEQAANEAKRIGADGQVIAEDAKVGAEKIIGQAKQKAGELKEKVVK